MSRNKTRPQSKKYLVILDKTQLLRKSLLLINMMVPKIILSMVINSQTDSNNTFPVRFLIFKENRIKLSIISLIANLLCSQLNITQPSNLINSRPEETYFIDDIQFRHKH